MGRTAAWENLANRIIILFFTLGLICFFYCFLGFYLLIELNRQLRAIDDFALVFLTADLMNYFELRCLLKLFFTLDQVNIHFDDSRINPGPFDTW